MTASLVEVAPAAEGPRLATGREGIAGCGDARAALLERAARLVELDLARVVLREQLVRAVVELQRLLVRIPAARACIRHLYVEVERLDLLAERDQLSLRVTAVDLLP